MHELASLGINLAAFGFVGMCIAGFFTEDDPNLPLRIDFILALGSSCIALFHPQVGLMMLGAVLTIALTRE